MATLNKIKIQNPGPVAKINEFTGHEFLNPNTFFDQINAPKAVAGITSNLTPMNSVLQLLPEQQATLQQPTNQPGSSQFANQLSTFHQPTNQLHLPGSTEYAIQQSIFHQPSSQFS